MSLLQNSAHASPSNGYKLADPNATEPNDADRVRHILVAINRLDELHARFTLAELLTEDILQSASCRAFGIIGTAAGATSAAFQRTYSLVPWARWASYGSALLREYDRVNYRLMWQKWEQEVASLRGQLHVILASEEPLRYV